ncbi:hypothetical protein [uncultured Sanguibacteroides sp.]|uniref:hypothetical protein n=1 Tax=uncultured Sanguibacteroides sp. TaxID=1635151 RepID=UPI0025F78776|nr:hypothetical protein [uncultured Sanguibacteroides sp.]
MITRIHKWMPAIPACTLLIVCITLLILLHTYRADTASYSFPVKEENRDITPTRDSLPADSVSKLLLKESYSIF